jgi:hypothetical protein
MIPQFLKRFRRKFIVRTFGLLQAKHIRLLAYEPTLDQRHSNQYGVYVPRSNFQWPKIFHFYLFLGCVSNFEP